MSTSSEYSEPIKSPQLEAQLSSMLARYNPDFKLIFHIIITTGVDLKSLLDMKVSDLYQKETLTFPGMHHRELTHEEPIPDDVRSMIDAAFSDRAPNEYAFIGTRSGQQMNYNTFTRALKRVSNICGCDPEVTLLSLHKTFVLKLFLKNRSKAYSYASAKGPAEMYKYLHLNPITDKTSTRVYCTTQEAIHSTDSLKSTRDAFISVTDDIKEKMAVPNTQSSEYYQHVLQFLSTVDSAIAMFTTGTTE